jgi:hypothetical protein
MNVEKHGPWFAEALAPGETIELLTGCQIKTGARQAGKRAAKTAVISAVTGVLGVGVAVTAPRGYLVITNQRVLLFGNQNGFGREQVGPLIMQAARDQIGARVKKGVLSQVHLFDRGGDEPGLRLNFGVAAGRASRFAAAIGDPSRG